ncbi:MAG TPA: GNAT family N-acetyltransferase [Alphaproteobacteria bacterium]|nr:GNAT family N-acetyltransferase [Alphaproteobacteria bacterium]
MPDGREPATIRLVERIAEIEAETWDAVAGADNPSVSHAFLAALEESGSACGETGWLPRHLVMEDEAGRLIAAAPMYLKGHSYGEYVFDHGWADAYERAGGRYYPKLQVAVPFTPVTGPRLLLHPAAPAGTRAALIAGMLEMARRLGVSSLHITFPTAEECHALAAAGLLQREGEQFHWRNPGYASFEDFLAALSSRKRKNIRKERAAALAGGIEILTLSGAAIEERHWDAFFRFYRNTGDRKWGHPYLTRDFFTRLGAGMADKVVLVMAEKRGRLVAGALNLRGRTTLYGRNWGSDGDYPFLHFECCYYRAIDFAIRHGLARVEAGAQGPHKIQRGYLPEPTYSAHWLRDPGFAKAVGDYLKRERQAVAQEREELALLSPFRKEPDRA